MNERCNCCLSKFEYFASHIDPNGLARITDPVLTIQNIWVSLGLDQDEYHDNNLEPDSRYPWKQFLADYQCYAQELESLRKWIDY